ncbi:MAG: hypothetical protein GC186_09455 [Rhodobacteraceae bacterium]|nr:hypothetical protein [Paracoccaceae bacterium]
MNKASARDYVRNVKYMRDGFAFKRTISAKAARHYLSNIPSDFGDLGMQAALKALEGHIEYYEKLQSVVLHQQRSILSEFRARPVADGSLRGLTKLMQEFDEDVRRAAESLQAIRTARLAAAERKPTKIVVTLNVFIRNPDVVAEALFRAKGTCEYCKRPAPFARLRDGTPYLEVHHKLPLAEGGEDSVENALALCPNCHREAHFGLLKDRFKE